MDKNAILMMLSDKIPSGSLPLLQDKLKDASEDKINSLATLPFKSHILGLILGFLFGIWGVDRFYKGDVGLGCVKLGLFIAGIIGTFFVIGGLFIPFVWVWSIVDLFLVWKGIKEDNLNKILTVLN